MSDTEAPEEPAPDKALAVLNPLKNRDEAFRAECYGEALTAVSRYLQDDILSPPSSETLGMLACAYERISEEFGTFTREDFALYTMSVLSQNTPEDSLDVQGLRRGAARYLLDVKPRLSEVFQHLSNDAEALLREAAAAEGDVLVPSTAGVETGPASEELPLPTEDGVQTTPPLPKIAQGVSRKGAMPYRRLDLAAANPSAFDGAGPARRNRPNRRNGAARSYAALGILFAGIVTGTGLTTYIALSLIFAN